MTPIVHVAGLTKRFGDFTAVDRLTIDVARGSIFAFLGANGSGKSTTIRMLIGVLRPTEGTIEVDGVDVVRTPRRVRDRIGYMGQKVSLYSGLTLRENVDFYAGLYGIEARDLAERWGRLRERFSLGDAEDEKSEALPAGIRQRAGLSLATLHDPALVFLDEPTAGVDVQSRALFWEYIQEEAEAGVTVFVTTHFLEEVEYCDHVSFIEAGRLVADASPAEIRARYSEGYRITIAGGRIEEAGAALHADGFAIDRTADALVFRVPVLEEPLARRLAALSASTGASVRIDPAPMTEVFRRVVAEAKAERSAA